MAYRILQLPPLEKSSENNGSESTSRQAEYSSEEGAAQQEERPREIAIRLSRKPPETPDEVAADAMLLVESFLEQYQVQLARAALILLLTEAQKANVIEGDAPAQEKKKPGRPKGSKNKPKQTGSAPPSGVPEPPQTGNDVDVDDSADARKAKMAELEDSAAEPPATPDDSLDLRGTFMDRRNEQQDDAGAAA